MDPGQSSSSPEVGHDGSQGESGKGRGRQGRGVDFPLRILVSSDMVGAIIGRGGATIRTITQETRARVDVHRLVIYPRPLFFITWIYIEYHLQDANF